MFTSLKTLHGGNKKKLAWGSITLVSVWRSPIIPTYDLGSSDRPTGSVWLKNEDLQSLSCLKITSAGLLYEGKWSKVWKLWSFFLRTFVRRPFSRIINQ
jgi:hypothetical protein